MASLFARVSRVLSTLSPFSPTRRYASLRGKCAVDPYLLCIGNEIPAELATAIASRPEYAACRISQDIDDVRTLATARLIVATAPLPSWFAVRKEQMLMFWDPNGYDQFPLSALLAADILLADEVEAARLNKRLGPIFSGRILPIAISAKDLAKACATPASSANPTAKKRLLIYGGALSMNGVTTSLLYRLRSLDYARYDVTLITPEKSLSAMEPVLNQLPVSVRVLPPAGHFSATLTEQYRWLRLSRRGGDPLAGSFVSLNTLFRREAQRRFGKASFDAVIDYSGYGAFYPLLLLQTPAKQRLIWQHNDIYRDMTNTQKGGQRRYRNFRAGLSVVTRLYPQFDRVVSASQAVWEANQQNFALPGRENTFVWCDNLIDAASVREKSVKDNTFTVDGRAYYQDTRTDVTAETALLSAPLPEPGLFHFATIGRLSPEKNHDSLLKAFARLSAENNAVHLTIIGSGEQESALRALATALGITEKVQFTGNLQNPFAYLKHFDAFAFVSHYEAMGLVVIEARILGLPILLSDYKAAPSVMVPGGQITVGQDPDSIYAGMRRLMAEPSAAKAPFDEAAWCEKSTRQFDRLFE